MSNQTHEPRNYDASRDARSNYSLWILGAALAAILIIVGLLGMRTTPAPVMERSASTPPAVTAPLPTTPPAAVAPPAAPATPAAPAPASPVAPRN